MSIGLSFLLLTSSRLEVAEYAWVHLEGKEEMLMEAVPETDNTQSTKGGPNPGFVRPPLVFLAAILLGIALNRARSVHFMPSVLRLLGPIAVLCAVLLYLFSYRAFHAAGTSVSGSKRTMVIVRTGPYRFSRNPIYLSFILLMLGLSV
jgi:protein-S-isoprenylcysteine O-methyltransferase Ste14